ncbi:MAG: glycosyltransferase [Candidatus Methylomirabilales bacterium]
MARAVLHLIETGGPGGAERMMVHLASSLGPGYHSEAALIRDRWLGGALKDRGIPVTILGNNPQGSIATLRDLVRVIRKKRVAILHTHEFFMNTLGLMASRLTGVPLVATVHERNYYPDRLRRRVAYRLVGRFAGQMVAVSEDLRRFLTERIGVCPDRIHVVANGVPVGEQPSPRGVATLRKKLCLDQHTQVLGTVGRLHSKKGHKYLIDAVGPVIRRFPHAVFLAVGAGGLRDELESQARRLGVASHLRFLGHRDDVRDFLALCDLFVLPSLSEGMPLSLLEAMAAGVPAVATRIAGITDVVEDGKTGLLVPPADSRALAKGITTLLEDRMFARQMGEAGREVVACRFSLAGMVRAYQEIYATLIRERNGGGRW